MSALTHLAALRMMERELLGLKCAGCGHALRSHPLNMRVDGTRCQHHDVIAHDSGNPSRAKLAYCRCREWVDPPGSDLLGALERRVAPD